MNYCSLEEAWGTQPTNLTKKNNTYRDHKKKFEKDNPIYTPNLNYECNMNTENLSNNKEVNSSYSGYDNKALTNYYQTPKSPENDELYNRMNNENKELHNFIKTLNMPEATKHILISKISSAIDSIKYENTNLSNDIREDFTNNYYKPIEQDNRNMDILFLILLGLFIIFILDKK